MGQVFSTCSDVERRDQDANQDEVISRDAFVASPKAKESVDLENLLSEATASATTNIMSSLIDLKINNSTEVEKGVLSDSFADADPQSALEDDKEEMEENSRPVQETTSDAAVPTRAKSCGKHAGDVSNTSVVKKSRMENPLPTGMESAANERATAKIDAMDSKKTDTADIDKKGATGKEENEKKQRLDPDPVSVEKPETSQNDASVATDNLDANTVGNSNRIAEDGTADAEGESKTEGGKSNEAAQEAMDNTPGTTAEADSASKNKNEVRNDATDSDKAGALLSEYSSGTTPKNDTETDEKAEKGIDHQNEKSSEKGDRTDRAGVNATISSLTKDKSANVTRSGKELEQQEKEDDAASEKVRKNVASTKVEGNSDTLNADATVASLPENVSTDAISLDEEKETKQNVIEAKDDGEHAKGVNCDANNAAGSLLPEDNFANVATSTEEGAEEQGKDEAEEKDCTELAGEDYCEANNALGSSPPEDNFANATLPTEAEEQGKDEAEKKDRTELAREDYCEANNAPGSSSPEDNFANATPSTEEEEAEEDQEKDEAEEKNRTEHAKEDYCEANNAAGSSLPEDNLANVATSTEEAEDQEKNETDEKDRKSEKGAEGGSFDEGEANAADVPSPEGNFANAAASNAGSKGGEEKDDEAVEENDCKNVEATEKKENNNMVDADTAEPPAACPSLSEADFANATTSTEEEAEEQGKDEAEEKNRTELANEDYCEANNAAGSSLPEDNLANVATSTEEAEDQEKNETDEKDRKNEKGAKDGSFDEGETNAADVPSPEGDFANAAASNAGAKGGEEKDDEAVEENDCNNVKDTEKKENNNMVDADTAEAPLSKDDVADAVVSKEEIEKDEDCLEEKDGDSLEAGENGNGDAADVETIRTDKAVEANTWSIDSIAGSTTERAEIDSTVSVEDLNSERLDGADEGAGSDEEGAETTQTDTLIPKDVVADSSIEREVLNEAKTTLNFYSDETDSAAEGTFPSKDVSMSRAVDDSAVATTAVKDETRDEKKVEDHSTASVEEAEVVDDEDGTGVMNLTLNAESRQDSTPSSVGLADAKHADEPQINIVQCDEEESNGSKKVCRNKALSAKEQKKGGPTLLAKKVTPSKQNKKEQNVRSKNKKDEKVPLGAMSSSLKLNKTSRFSVLDTHTIVHPEISTATDAVLKKRRAVPSFKHATLRMLQTDLFYVLVLK